MTGVCLALAAAIALISCTGVPAATQDAGSVGVASGAQHDDGKRAAAEPTAAQPTTTSDPSALSWCKNALSKREGPLEGEERVVAYRERKPGVEVKVCARNDGSMKIADILSFELQDRPALELASDVANGVLLPRIEWVERIDSERLLALGWWRSPPMGVSALLIGLPRKNARPILHEQLRVEGWSSRLLLDQRDLRRIGVLISDPNAEIMVDRRRYEPASLIKSAAPSARRFWRCTRDADAGAKTVLAFGGPDDSCGPGAPEVMWFAIRGNHFESSKD